MKINNITLIRIENKSINVYSTFYHPGLALPIIGTVLKNSGYNVKIYIDSIQPPPREVLHHSDIVGFSVNSSCFLETYAFAKQLKEEYNNTVVFGGPHVTFMASEALNYCDFVVRGEGEHTIMELLRYLENDLSSFKDIKGLSWRDSSGQIHHNPDRSLVKDLSLIPDQSLIIGYRKKMSSFIQKIFPTGMLVCTSRGCYHKCSFCTIPLTFGKRIRYRDYDTVIVDIKEQLDFSKNKYIYFTDDNFAVNPIFTKGLLQRIIDEKLNIHFSAQVRCEITLDKELMELMVAAGAYLVFVGFESINDDSLKLFKKGGKQSRAQIEKSIIEFHKYKIKVHGMFVVGADTDKPGIATSIAQWALERDLDSLQILPVCPLPGTEIITQLEQQNRIIKSYNPETEETYINYGVGNSVLYKPKMMKATELQEEIITAYKIFYNYKNIFKSLRHIFSKGIETIIYKIIGNNLIRKGEPEINRHLKWLYNIESCNDEKEKALVCQVSA